MHMLVTGYDIMV